MNGHVVDALYHNLEVQLNLCARGVIKYMEYSVKYDNILNQISREMHLQKQIEVK